MIRAGDSGSNNIAFALPLGCYSLVPPPPQGILRCRCHPAQEMKDNRYLSYCTSIPRSPQKLKRTAWLHSCHSGLEFCVTIMLYSVDLLQGRGDCLHGLYPIPSTDVIITALLSSIEECHLRSLCYLFFPTKF